MISADIILWGAAGFFVTGAFMAWREEYRSNRPIEIRERLDAYLRQRQRLHDLWMKKGRPKIRTKNWNRRVVRFVKNHFSLSDYDHIKSNIISEDDLEIGIALKLGASRSWAFDTAEFLDIRLEVLKQLRRKIRD